MMCFFNSNVNRTGAFSGDTESFNAVILIEWFKHAQYCGMFFLSNINSKASRKKSRSFKTKQ